MHFTITINSDKQKVWKTMLDLDTYKVRTDIFSAGSYYEGSWEKGSKILFLDPSRGGMTAMIAENIPYEFVSIKHLGYVKDGVEDTTSDEVKSWIPAYENYTFTEKDGVTTVAVELTKMLPELEEYMQDARPKALQKLKEICEK